jgi:hypothetical protein
MATYEQCERVMRERFKTRQDVLDFCKQFQSGKHTSQNTWTTDGQFIEGNIKAILDYQERLGRLDHLGRDRKRCQEDFSGWLKSS